MARPLVVVWRVTEACDLSCWFCEYNRRLRRPRQVADAAAVLALGKALSEYSAASARPVLVSWLGGEPLLWPALMNAGRRLHEDFGLALGLTTSGWHFNRPGLIDHLAETYAEITVSVDGLAAAHDAGRGAPGLFERVRLGVGALRDSKQRRGQGPLLRANTILMHSNVHALEALGHKLADWGIEEMTFNPLGGRPPGPYYLRERLQPEDARWLRGELPGLRERLLARGLRLLASARYLGRLSDAAAGVPVHVTDCHPGADFLFVDERGRVSPCAFVGEGYGVPAAELRHAADLAELPARFAAQRRQMPAAACQDCASTQVFGKFEWAEAA